MPELPEVETVKRVLKESIVGLKIKDVIVYYDNIIFDDKDYFIKNIINKTIIDINRYGKFLIFNLDNGNIISHLRMEGKYFYLKKDELFNKHIHLKYVFDNGYELLYQDVRKFGRSYYINDDIYNKYPLNTIGYDLVLAKDFDYELIHNKLLKKHIPIKTALLDQSILAGLGNIYVDEVLYASHIAPNRLSKDISLDEVKDIIKKSNEILNLAIINKGTTIKSYTSSLNVYGEYQKFLKVHTKTVCSTCNNILNRDRINGRTTYYCKNCQR